MLALFASSTRVLPLAFVVSVALTASASAKYVTVPPTPFCEFGTWTDWVVFDYEGRRFSIPRAYDRSGSLSRRVDADRIGYSAIVDVRDFTPWAEGEQGEGAGVSHAARVSVTTLAPLSNALKWLWRGNHGEGPEDASRPEKRHANGLWSFPQSEFAQSIIYFERGTEDAVQTIVRCPSTLWTPLWDGHRSVCQMTFRAEAGVSVLFDRSLFDEWSKIRSMAAEFARCALTERHVR